MKRKKHTFRATDETYRLIQSCARMQGRTVSDFVVYHAMSEVKKRVGREDLREMLYPIVSEIVCEVMKNQFPHVGKAPGSTKATDTQNRTGLKNHT